jgi:hypothetical protein
MAIRTWVRLLLATLGVGALAGASQLGVAYGLGIVRLTRVVDVTTRDQWTAQLGWVAWFAMTAAVVGALVGARLLAAWGSPADAARAAADPVPGTGTVIALALAAGLGAAIVVPLTMQPARTAQIAGVHPVFVIGICAGLGALVGVFAAIAALMQPVSRWGLAAVSLATWFIAIVSVAPSLAPDDPLPAVRLGVFDPAYLSTQTAQRSALFTMPVLALITGALLGWAARRRERSTLTIALAGLPGPALLTLAYLIAGPGAGGERYQVVPYWAAMTATGAGVLGSVLAAVLRRFPADETDADADADGGHPPLPRRPEQHESAIAKAGGPPMGDEELAAAAYGPGSAKPGDTGILAAPKGGAPKDGAPTGGDVPTPGAPTGDAPKGDTTATSAAGDQPGRRPSTATSAPWGPPSGGPAPLGMAPGFGAGGLGGPPTRTPIATTPEPSAADGPGFFSGARPAPPAATGRTFRPSSWRRSSRKSGTPDPFATPAADWPATGSGGPATAPDAAGSSGPSGRGDDRDAGGGVAVGDYALGELPPFNGFARGAANPGKAKSGRARSGKAGPGPTPAGRPTQHADTQHAATQQAATQQAATQQATTQQATTQHAATREPAPYVPAPATSPLPPEVLNPAPGSMSPTLGSPSSASGHDTTSARGHDTTSARGHDTTSARGHGAASARDTTARSAGRTGPDEDRPGRHDRGPDPEAPKPKTRRWGRGRNKAADAEPPTPAKADRPPAAQPPAAQPPVAQTLADLPLGAKPPAVDRPAAGQPLVPEPQAVSAPLPNPEPITPPITAPTPVQGSVTDKRRPPRQKRGDDDYVDWVSGLGGQ